jgi:neurotransmitter:Na+ symporter, NSS family
MFIKFFKKEGLYLEKKNTKREGFSSGLAVFFATLGSAVGLGNIWRFPYLTGENGGGAFLLIYLICIVVVGLPIMIGEFYIGKKAKKNVMGAIKILKPKSKFWRLIAWGGILASYFIMFFYSSVGGWVYSYVYKAISGKFVGVNADTAKSIFDNTSAASISPILWQILVISVVSLILIAGVKKGIEKITKTLMPVLFMLIIICDIRALTLPHAYSGISFLFSVNFHKITPAIILVAMGLAFFKLSIGMGTMVTYSSYFIEETDLIATSVKVALSDTLVSILAGLAIFPAVFSFGMQPSLGPGLLFQTIPLVFSKLPAGSVLLAAFFILAAIAATTAMISMVEVVIAFFSEELGLNRIMAVIINAIIIICIGAITTISFDGGSAIGKVHIFNMNFFDLFDNISSSYLLPLGGLLVAILVGYFIPGNDVKKVLSNNGRLKNQVVIDIFLILIRFITPILIILVFLNSIHVIG